MQVNKTTNTASKATYKTLNVADKELMVPPKMPVVVFNPMPPTQVPAPAAPGPNLLEVALTALNPLGAFGMQIGKWVGDWLAPKPPAPAPPVSTTVVVAPPAAPPQAPSLSAGDRRRFENAYRELDEDRNGRLEGDELTSNGLMAFDPDTDAGMTMSDFVDEASKLEGADGISAASLRRASLKSRIFDLMTEVWGHDRFCNDTSYAWWKGQLKLAGGDFDKLRDTMTAYKKSIER
jgi:hypothetical protein